VLVAGFLLQPLLAYLVTPLVAHDREGRQVVVCTLKGERLVTLDLPRGVDSEPVEHCSALKLFQMAGTAQLCAPPPAPAPLLYSNQILDQVAEHPRRSLHFSVYATRAPPALS
jgi:hypothetical protein